jgi:hypothetical protein
LDPKERKRALECGQTTKMFLKETFGSFLSFFTKTPNGGQNVSLPRITPILPKEGYI